MCSPSDLRSRHRLRAATVGALSGLLTLPSAVAGPTPPSGQTLLQSRFGVTLTLQPALTANTGYDDNGDGLTGGSYMFDHTSFVPTKNTQTVDWTEGDWFGRWDNNFAGTTVEHPPAPGTADLDHYPSGGEIYDVEAMYFDNDADYVYMAIVTSVPFLVDTNGDTVMDDVGIIDPRIAAGRAFIRPGDLSIDLQKAGTARNERAGATWHYNYGLNLADEIRPDNDNTNDDVVTVGAGTFTTCFLRSLSLGTGLYRTTSDLPSPAADVVYPTTGDWYTGSRSGHTAAGYEHTNFDPSHPQFSGTFMGNATWVSYYRYAFAGGHEENGSPTYVIEAIIPRTLFGTDNPATGASVGMRWVEGCRNDGQEIDSSTFFPALSVTGDIDPVGTISGAVLTDDDGNGSGDTGLGGVGLKLYTDPDGNGDAADGTLIQTTTSAAGTGAWSFTNLAPGAYVIHQIQPSGYSSVTDTDSTADAGGSPADAGDAAGDNSIAANLALGETDTGNDFVEVLTLSIGNLVFADVDGNGIYSSGEGIDGVTVQLFSTGPDGMPGGTDDVQILTGPDGILGTTDDATGDVSTAPGGCYLFSGLTVGTYYVKIPAVNFTAGKQLTGLVSLPGAGGNTGAPDYAGINDADDDADENGIDSEAPGVTGITSYSILLTYGGEPGPATETGKDSASDDGAQDNLSNLTVDFGFRPAATLPCPKTVLYVCGNNKTADAMPYDHGVIGWLTAQGYAVTAALPSAGGLLDPGTGAPILNGPGSPAGPDDFNCTVVSHSAALDLLGNTGGITSALNTTTHDVVLLTYAGLDTLRMVNVDAAPEFEAGAPSLPGVFDGTVWIENASSPLLPAGFTSNTAVTVYNDYTTVGLTGYPVGIAWGRGFGAGVMTGAWLKDPDTGENRSVYFGYARGSALANGDLAPGRRVMLGLIIDGASILTPEINPEDPANFLTADGAALLTAAMEAGCPCPAAIGNLVWNDVNNNGQVDATPAESGIGSVDLTLCFDSNADGDFSDPGEADFATTTTAPDGSYAFTGLQPGSYQIKVPVPPAGLPLASTDADPADNGQDDDSNGTQSASGDPVTGPVILLTDGETDGTVDFGFYSAKPAGYEDWAIFHGLDPAQPAGDLDGNPDGDRYSNLAEFAFCFDPASGIRTACPLEIVVNPGTGRIDACLHQVTGITGVTYTLQTAGSLGNPTSWTDVTTLTTTVTPAADGTETVCYEDLASLGSAWADGDGFARIQVTSGGSTASSPVMGWQMDTQGVYCQTFAAPLLPCEFLSATVDSGSSLLDLTTATGTGDLRPVIGGLDCLYVEITDGPQEGQRFAVDTAATAAGDGKHLALDAASSHNTRSPIPDLAGSPLVLRRLYTLNELFPPASYHAGTNVSNADKILAFDNATGQWSTWFLADLAPARWLFSGSPGIDDDGGRCVAPCEGLFIHRTATPLDTVLTGEVRANDFACPAPGGYSLVAGGWPLDQSPAGRAMGLTDGFQGGLSSASADQILLWHADAVSGAENQCYRTLFLLDAGAPLDYWTLAGDPALTNLSTAPVFLSGHAAFLCLGSGQPAWIMPVPWTP